MKRLSRLLGAALLATAGCGYVSFRKPMTDDELRLEREIRGYYAEIRAAFAAGNPQSLATLFDPNITSPMSRPEVERWAEKFFAEHGRAHFKIEGFSLDELAFERAVVTLRYRVDTPDGRGGFGGAERDTLVKKSGRWYTAAWERLKD